MPEVCKRDNLSRESVRDGEACVASAVDCPSQLCLDVRGDVKHVLCVVLLGKTVGDYCAITAGEKKFANPVSAAGARRRSDLSRLIAKRRSQERLLAMYRLRVR